MGIKDKTSIFTFFCHSCYPVTLLYPPSLSMRVVAILGQSIHKVSQWARGNVLQMNQQKEKPILQAMNIKKKLQHCNVCLGM